MEKKKVVVGMSGGVDSSVAAYLLKEQGYDVIGVTMQIWQDEEPEEQEENGGCCGLSAVDDARRVAGDLGIPYYVMNFKKEFKENVINYFIDEYLHGRTPNPCIACNRYVKWESLLKRSMEIGADYIATGHYARIEQLPNGRYSLKRSATLQKDQTYALYNLTQEQLSRTLMPVGEYTKDEVREIADKINLRVANKPDSQDICFVPDGDYAAFIEQEEGNLPPEGNFVSVDGKVLGKHKGIIHYTVGQRKGLGLSLGYPAFVLEIRPETNEVVIGTNEDSMTYHVRANRLNFMSIESLEGEMRVFAKIRYNHKGAWCTIKMSGEDEVLCTFEEQQRAVTPGQAVVFYDGDYVLGGGTIIGEKIKMIADFHTHTNFSSDAEREITPEMQIQAAIQRGLKIYCVTDHYDEDYPSVSKEAGETEFKIDLPRYFEELSALREKYQSQIDLRIGIEIGLQPHLGAFYKKLVNAYPFDFVIGSAHVFGGADPYFNKGISEKSDEQTYREAFEEMLLDIQNVNDFDVLGHIDYVVRYGMEQEKHYSYKKYADILDEILKTVIAKGKGIELNTAGFKYGLGFAHPKPEVLKRYRELGGEIITVGSDGHKPEHLAYDFHKTEDILREAGFKYYTVFKDRMPNFIAIS